MSDLEAIRAANIARNERALAALGLSSAAEETKRKATQTRRAQAKRRRVSRAVEDRAAVRQVPRRQSSRIAVATMQERQAQLEREEAEEARRASEAEARRLDRESRRRTTRRRTPVSRSSSTSVWDTDVNDRSPYVDGDEVDELIDAAYEEEAARISVAPNRLVDDEAVKDARVPRGAMSSAARTDVDLSFIQGDSEQLGRVFEPEEGSGQLKAAAVDALAVTGCRFSRMSGILPFANAVVLFVNLDMTNGYDNRFIGPPTGLHLTWFAQATQTTDSPVIQRMLATSDDDRVLLCLRRPAEAYLFAGRLEATEVFPHLRPVKIIWRLVDAPVLATKEEFRDLINLRDEGATDAGANSAHDDGEGVRKVWPEAEQEETVEDMAAAPVDDSDDSAWDPQTLVEAWAPAAGESSGTARVSGSDEAPTVRQVDSDDYVDGDDADDD